MPNPVPSCAVLYCLRCVVLCGWQVLPEVAKVRFSVPAAAAAVKAEPAADAAAAVDTSGQAASKPGSSGGKRGSAASKGTKGKQQQRRRFYDTSSESDWTDSEVRGSCVGQACCQGL